MPITKNQRSGNWKSKYTVELSLPHKLKMVMNNKAYRYLVIAAFFRFSGGYSLGYWAKSYFSGVYPEYQDQYAFFYFFILLAGGTVSELVGGFICDKYEPKHPAIKG